MSKRRVFISYDHSEDVRYRNLLSAWDANSAFEFEFNQCSPSVAINSKRAAVIKRSLTRMMKKSDYLLVIVGEKTHTSKWVNWEINRAKRSDVDLKLVAVKLDKLYKTPTGLLNAGTSFAYSFTEKAIIQALKDA
ncbi:MTH538 TIR-like domain [Hymenobacter actinosclerus]|uniref:MTH538 TIR-like domain n=1 Tax=Hymenobacter actinosclerus TaxID=82805 RepID=A0A1I0J984_9BACT|nr:MTH538 TIR-like domain [Hymenobacter actinosclerus]